MGRGSCQGQAKDRTRVSGEARQVPTECHQHRNIKNQSEPYTSCCSRQHLCQQFTPIISSFPPDIIPTKRAGDYGRIRQMTSSGQLSGFLRITASNFTISCFFCFLSLCRSTGWSRDESSMVMCNMSIMVPSWLISQGLLRLTVERGGIERTKG